MEKLELSYLKPQEARRYSYYSVPKLLIDHPAFDGIDYGAKLLYSLILSRASLSAENAEDFTDEQGRLYIIYTVDQVRKDLRCSKPTAVKFLDQLCTIGLIEKKRRGQGKPTLVYVKDFSSVAPMEMQQPETPQEPDGETAPNSRSQDFLLLEVKDVDFKKSKKLTSRSKDFLPPEVKGFNPNYLDLNYPDSSYIPSIPPSSIPPQENGGTDGGMDVELLEAEVKEQIEYDVLVERRDKDQADEIVRLITNVLCRGGPEIRIGQASLPAQAVKRRFRELNLEHVDYALDKLVEVQREGPVRNVGAYLLVLLYNAPANMITEIGAKVEAKYGLWNPKPGGGKYGT